MCSPTNVLTHQCAPGLVSLRSSRSAPVAYRSSGLQGAPRWRHLVQETPVDDNLFPLHSPLNYVRWLGAQKKRVVEIAQVEQAGLVYGAGDRGGLRRSLAATAGDPPPL